MENILKDPKIEYLYWQMIFISDKNIKYKNYAIIQKVDYSIDNFPLYY